jgi:protein-S-isoprenylcysteine O-methyltransferase Ste14
MRDLPAFIIIAVVWSYWVGVLVMVIRVRTKWGKPAGIVPEVPHERLLWLVWVPLIGAWMALPVLAVISHHRWLAIPKSVLTKPALLSLRWLAAACALACLVLTIDCWRRMGRNWQVGVLPSQKTDLVTDGLYARIRHPIYALGTLLVLCSVVIVPTGPMIILAAVHVIVMTLKIRSEERFLREVHGEAYTAYCRRTGRFLPRLSARNWEHGRTHGS